MIRKGILPLLLLSSVALAPAFSQEANAPDANSEALSEQVIAYGGGGEHGHMRGEHDRPDFIKQLNITDDQLEKLAALKSAYADKTAVKRTELHSLSRQIGDAMSQTTVDRSKVTSLHNKAQSLKDDLSNARLAYMLDRADVFTDQRAQMHHWKLVHQFMGHHHGHGGWGHHGGA